MSAAEPQGNFANSAKDDDNNVVPATISENADMEKNANDIVSSISGTSIQPNTFIPVEKGRGEAKEQINEDIPNTDDVKLAPKSPKDGATISSELTSGNLCADDEKQSLNSPDPSIDEECLKSPDGNSQITSLDGNTNTSEDDLLNDYNIRLLEHTDAAKTSLLNVAELNIEKEVKSSINYKETIIDDTSTSSTEDLELKWDDDDDDDGVLLQSSEPLSAEALKQLDDELGITDDGEIIEKPDEVQQLISEVADLVEDKVTEVVEPETEQYAQDSTFAEDVLILNKCKTQEQSLKDTVQSEIVNDQGLFHDHDMDVEKDIISSNVIVEKTTRVAEIAKNNNEDTTEVEAFQTLDIPSVNQMDDCKNIKSSTEMDIDLVQSDKTTSDLIQIKEKPALIEITQLKELDRDNLDMEVDSTTQINLQRMANTEDISDLERELTKPPTFQDEKGLLLEKNTDKESLPEIKGIVSNLSITEEVDSSTQINFKNMANTEDSSDLEKKLTKPPTSQDEKELIFEKNTDKESLPEITGIVSNISITEENEEFITPDLSNDDIKNISIKIKTDHRLNRPDVMLDIPTQDFIDIDAEMDETEEKNYESLSPSESIEENDIKLTVTDIVNQLSKDEQNLSGSMDIMQEITDKIDISTQKKDATEIENTTTEESLEIPEIIHANSNLTQKIVVDKSCTSHKDETKSFDSTAVTSKPSAKFIDIKNIQQNTEQIDTISEITVSKESEKTIDDTFPDKESTASMEIQEVAKISSDSTEDVTKMESDITEQMIQMTSENAEELNKTTLDTEEVEKMDNTEQENEITLATKGKTEKTTSDTTGEVIKMESDISEQLTNMTSEDAKIITDATSIVTEEGTKTSLDNMEVPKTSELARKDIIKHEMDIKDVQQPTSSTKLTKITSGNNEEVKISSDTSAVPRTSEQTSKDTTKHEAEIIAVQPSTSLTEVAKMISDNSEELKTSSDTKMSEQILKDTTKHIDIINEQPSTSSPELTKTKSDNTVELKTSSDTSEVPKTEPTELVKMTSDYTEEVQEVTDSLGLLAESSRVMDDDEEPDQEPEDDVDVDDDDDEDFDPSDESNHTAENSEDSNAPTSENEAHDKETRTTTTKAQIKARYIDPDGIDLVSDSNEATADSADAGVSDSNEATDAMDIVDDIECEEMEIPTDIKGDENEILADETTAAEDGEPKKDEVSKLVSTNLGVESSTDKQEEVLNSTKQELSSKAADKDAETDKQSESSDTDAKTRKKRRDSILKDLLSRPSEIGQPAEATGRDEQSPPESKKLDTSKQRNVVNIVDLGESSSEDDVNEIQKEAKQDSTSAPKNVIKIDSGTIEVPKGISGTLGISEDGKMTSDEKSKTDAAVAEKDNKDKTKMGGEVFSLDSDDEECADNKRRDKPRRNTKCINNNCSSDASSPHYLADAATVAYYSAAKRRRAAVCQCCREKVIARTEGLLNGIKDLRPLLDLDMTKPSQQLVEISDSESEDEGDFSEQDIVGEKSAKLIEEQLADLINETWAKYKMDSRLKETEDFLQSELEKMEEQSKEINDLLDECQKATDKLRLEFYSGFESERRELPALNIHDTPIASYSCLERDFGSVYSEPLQDRYPKRRAAVTATEPPTKKHAAQPDTADAAEPVKQDDDKDISVVKLSAESAPPDLPPPGDIFRPPLRTGMSVYAMKNAFGAWLKGKIMDTMAKTASQQFTPCRIKFEHKCKNSCKVLTGRCIAYTDPSPVRMTIGTRVIALFKDQQVPNRRESFYSGVIAEIPNPVNNYRYLVFFDDGYAQYVQHSDTRLVAESSTLVWEEVHPFSRDFVSNYLLKYPERPMVRMHQGQTLTVEWNGKWWETKVIQVDASLVQVHFAEDNRTEWIYRGSTRLHPLFVEFQAAGRARTRLPRSKHQTRSNMPYVEYTRSEEQANKPVELQTTQQQHEDLRRQRSVAKKSTALPTAQSANQQSADTVVSRVVYYTPKNAVRPHKLIPHTCGLRCKRDDVLSLRDLRTYNPLAKPLLSGWERQVVRFKCHKDVMYRAPCGRRLRDVTELHRYLRVTQSDMAVDLFDFHPNTHCLAEFVLNKCIVGKKDLSHGKENVPVPCVNYYDDSLPEFCSYNTERTPTAGVPLNLDPEFLCGCDCTDDCVDKTKCACWKMTLEGARTIGIDSQNIGYEYRRLPEPLPSGIYECNSRCKCKHTCLNRVAQHPLQLKLQVFKTLNRGWGIRALNDVPKGAFLCVYAGNLLTDATANLDGLNEGDEYLAELDYIEVVEAMKEGYEEDIPDADKKLDKKESKKSDSEEEEEEQTESEEETKSDNDKEDDDFQPGFIGMGLTEFNKRLRKRERKKNKGEERREKDQKEGQAKNSGDDCITISDDEEVREPSRFMAQEGMDDTKVASKYRSIRTHYGKDEACYIMDAKVQGNIGRYLNHSCSPNVFVQNVFVDTHDPRFPWVAFFALHHIRAGTELTWNYNYDVGSVPGKILYCYCGAHNCRGRLL